jgi:hypothetical protein
MVTKKKKAKATQERVDSKVVNFRLDASTFDAFKECVEKEGTTVTRVLRSLVRKYMKRTAEQAKA